MQRISLISFMLLLTEMLYGQGYHSGELVIDLDQTKSSTPPPAENDDPTARLEPTGDDRHWGRADPRLLPGRHPPVVQSQSVALPPRIRWWRPDTDQGDLALFRGASRSLAAVQQRKRKLRRNAANMLPSLG
ncbi:uncharacterized protein BDV14DRAFT_168640 [Aspergillus stella-maris]|uniref:uncharacterized protein n=1 Tax=Aspergillus stella-maris TaxID=1810926 RepID=UPI003CCC95EA